jgi:hypothetical protein
MEGSLDFVGTDACRCTPEEGAAILAARETGAQVRPHPELPDDTKLWAALQRLGGGTWGGCVYDVDAILKAIG